MSNRQPDSTQALGAGLTFAVTMALFALGGLWVDNRLSTQPLFLLVGVALALIGGTIHLLRLFAPGTLPFGRKPDGKPPSESNKPNSPS